MTIDQRIQQAALATACHYLIRGAQKNPARAARNLMEAACNICRQSPDELLLLSDRLKALLESPDEKEVLSWLYKTFGLS